MESEIHNLLGSDRVRKKSADSNTKTDEGRHSQPSEQKQSISRQLIKQTRSNTHNLVRSDRIIVVNKQYIRHTKGSTHILKRKTEQNRGQLASEQDKQEVALTSYGIETKCVRGEGANRTNK